MSFVRDCRMALSAVLLALHCVDRGHAAGQCQGQCQDQGQLFRENSNYYPV